jgi:hypothetical protein
MTDSAADGEERTYGGLLGAFPYAFRSSESRLFRLYTVVGGLLTLFVTLMFAISVVVLVANTTGVTGGVFTFSRAFFVFVGFLVALPLVAPILYVARHHRRREGEPIPRYDLAMALAGFGYLFALYVGLVISMPECFDFGDQVQCRPAPSGPFAPVVGLLYSLPSITGLLPPVIAGSATVVLDRLLG